MLKPIKNLSLVLVMTSSMSVPICNRFHATRANSGKITTFRKVADFDAHMRRPPRTYGSGLGLLKFTFNAKISYAGCLGLSSAISLQFTVEMCAAAKNCKNHQNPFLDTKSFKFIEVDKFKSPSPVLVMISSKSVPICNRFHTVKAKITSFYGTTLL